MLHLPKLPNKAQRKKLLLRINPQKQLLPYTNDVYNGVLVLKDLVVKCKHKAITAEAVHIAIVLCMPNTDNMAISWNFLSNDMPHCTESTS